MPGLQRLLPIIAAAYAASLAVTSMAVAQTAAEPKSSLPLVGLTDTTTPPQEGWSFKPDAGIVYQEKDFRFTTWGFAEFLANPGGASKFRRVRQGSSFELPRINDWLRPAFVYEFDLTNTNFFANGWGGRDGVGRRNLENAYVALQNPDDPNKFRVLFGENTHILSREDNLSSGNLATINRSLVLEEFGSVNGFGTQFGIQAQKILSDSLAVQFAALDNRGSFNAPTPRYSVGNSLSAKLIATPLNDEKGGRKLVFGVAIDNTRDIGDKTFTLASAISQAPLGGVAARGDSTTGEADVAFTFPVLGHPWTLEAETIYGRFSDSRTDVFGGYGMIQISLFDTPAVGDFDVFLRYDIVDVGTEELAGRVRQRAFRTGFNYNLPGTNKLANLHLEYAKNYIDGPQGIVTGDHESDEVRLDLRISLQQYTRH